MLRPEDLADILFLAYQYDFEWEDVLDEARAKDLWVEPLEVCRLINTFPLRLLEDIKWIVSIDLDKIDKDIKVLHDNIFMGRSNTLYYS